ncbi:hypothetical protein LshimejAT787_4300050 [Lyophyllum shimeji]|uniref:Uncharacterized protein n=1 Tax=Lyophyllum shimeji TaxID=47721 RepID=A0A9P3Q1L0_LYOSH|nr:hypothetical protein LshimejAT787_4300050 [Lyophyllum shimeji]
MQSGSDVAPQDPATDPAQEAWRRLTMVEARLEHQAGQLTEILNTFHELRLYVEQRATHTVPGDSGPTMVQLADAAQTPAHSDPLSAQSFTRGRDRLRPAPPDSFDGEREKGRAFINSCDLYMSLTPDAFSDEQTRINWVLSYMKGGRAARFAACTLRYPNSHDGVPRFGTYAEFRAQFIAEFCPRDEKRKAATTFETSTTTRAPTPSTSTSTSSRTSGRKPIPWTARSWCSAFRHGLDPRIEAKVTNMVDGRPSDERVQEWIDVARLVGLQHPRQPGLPLHGDQAAHGPAPVVRNPRTPAASACSPLPHLVQSQQPFRSHCSSQSLPSPGVPMDIDLSCQRSRTPDHLPSMQEAWAHRSQLPRPIRHLLHDDSDDWVMGLLADLDTGPRCLATEAQAEAPAAAEEERSEGPEEGF